MYITAVIAAQSIGTSSNQGNGLFPQKVTAQTDTAGYTIAVQLTNGTSGYDPNQRVTLFYTSSPFSYTAANAVLQLRQQAQSMDVRPDQGTGAIQTKTTPLAILFGLYVYFWFDVPKAPVAQTLAASLVEI